MRRRVLLLSGLALGGAVAAWGCNAVLGLGDYQVRTDGGPNPTNCTVDLTKQCFPCAPGTDPEFLNSCTGAACVSFDPKRVTLLSPDGSLPAYPKYVPPDAGPVVDAATDAPPPVDAGTDAPPPATCANVKTGTPVVYVTGTAKPYVQALATALFNDVSPIVLVYKGQSSCVAWDAALNGTVLSGPASYWPGTTTETTCNIQAGGVVADVSISDIFASSCTALPNGLPKGVGDFFGPAQAMAFIVPKLSAERSISAQAAYFVYGFGAQSGVTPWTDPNYIFRLDDTSGTQRIIGAGIGVPAAEWKGTNLNFSGKLTATLPAVPTAAAPSTIGILSEVNITDALRQQIHVLAYRHYGQTCAVYPDSTETNRDKSNVRDGHYTLWGPLHLSAHLDANGFVSTPNAKRVVNYFTGITPPPSGLDLIETEALNNLVPQCAMKVTRSTEMGPLSPFAAQNACGCYFEQKATGQTACTKCTTSAGCPASAPACSFGYCEAQ